MSILKTISVHSSPEIRDAKAKIEELQNSLERFKKEIMSVTKKNCKNLKKEI